MHLQLNVISNLLFLNLLIGTVFHFSSLRIEAIRINSHHPYSEQTEKQTNNKFDTDLTTTISNS